MEGKRSRHTYMESAAGSAAHYTIIQFIQLILRNLNLSFQYPFSSLNCKHHMFADRPADQDRLVPRTTQTKIVCSPAQIKITWCPAPQIMIFGCPIFYITNKSQECGAESQHTIYIPRDFPRVIPREDNFLLHFILIFSIGFAAVGPPLIFSRNKMNK